MKKKCLFPFVLILCGFILFIPSCGKKWKKPCNVSFNFQLNANSNTGIVKFTNGSIFLSRLSFDGERKQGDKNVSFEQTYNSQQISFNQSLTNSAINFDIPQGTYSKIQVGFASSSLVDSIGSLQINGYYVTTINDTIPVLFRISAPETFLLNAVNSTGSNEILLVEDKPSVATIVLNPTYWFANISQTQLENAAEEEVEGVPTIVIDIDSDNEMFTLIVGRISEGNQIVFK